MLSNRLAVLGGKRSAGLDLNFVNGSALDSRIAFSRASVATYFDATGTLQTASSGVARIDYGPTPGGITNWIRNSSMVGAVAGSPGTLPTVSWAESHGAGLTRTIVGTGTESGIPYIDIRWNGTTADTAGCYINYEVQAGVQVALGQAWTFTGYCRLVGGSVANITSIGSNVIDSNSVPVQVDFAQTLFTPTGAALSTQKFTLTHTIAQATAVYIMPRTFAVIASGVAIDITLRFGAPQLELGATASQWISTSGAVTNLGAVPKGLLIEETRTNGIRNNSGTGAVAASPGTLPTNWGSAAASGLTRTIVGTGTENGISYIDFQFAGTTADTNGLTISFETLTGVVAANAQTWTCSSYFRLVGGTTTGVTSFNLYVLDLDGSQVQVDAASVAFTPTSLPLALQRVTLTHTVTQATTASMLPRLILAIPNTTAVNFTLRIGLPQLELGSFTTSPIPTTSAAVTRSNDSLSMPTAGWFAGALTNGTIEAEYTSEYAGNAASANYVLCFDDGTNNNRFLLRSKASAGAVAAALIVTNGSLTTSGTLLTDAVNVASKLAMAWSGAGVENAVGNAGTVQAMASASPLGQLATLRIGQSNGGGQLNGWLSRIRYWSRMLANSELQSVTSGASPSLDLDFVNSTTLDSRITFTRASVGSYFDATGTLQSASTNVARYDYTGSPSPAGVTNWLPLSASVGSNASNLNNVTVVANNAIAPDGTTTATLVTETTATSQHLIANQLQKTPIIGDVITTSCYFKASGSTTPGMTANGEGTASYDLVAVSAAHSGTCTAATITSAGNGWYRCTATFTKSETSPNVYINVSGNFGSYAGLTSRSCYAWGWQGEYAATAGLYVPTVLSATNAGARPAGLLIEEVRTNSIRVNNMAGAVVGTPGTLPTNWSQVVGTGVNFNVVGSGSENGIAYLDVQISGTTTAANNNLFFETTTQVAALTAQTWTLASYVRLVGGSAANVTILQVIRETTAGGATVLNNNSSSLTPTSAALATQRQAYTVTLSGGATTAFIAPYLQVQCPAGAVNVTLRIGLPQCELGAFATSPISTSSIAVTRAVEVATMPASNSFYVEGGGPGTIGGEYLPGMAGVSPNSQYPISIDNGTTTDRYALRGKGGGSAVSTALVASANTAVATAALMTDVVGTVSKLALTWSGGAVQNACGNAGTVQSIASPPPVVTLTTVSLGNTAAGSQLNGWLRRCRYWPRMMGNAELQSTTT